MKEKEYLALVNKDKKGYEVTRVQTGIAFTDKFGKVTIHKIFDSRNLDRKDNDES